MAGIVHRHYQFGRRGYRQRVYVERITPQSNTPLKNFMVSFALGMLILSTLQTLSGHTFSAGPKGVRICLQKNSVSLFCTSMHLGLSTKWFVTTMDKSPVSNVVKAVSILVILWFHFQRMTRLQQASTPEQPRFNTAHCKTRCAIEHLNGVLKRRFALRVEPQGVCNIKLACIVLHNIATRRNVSLMTFMKHLSLLKTWTNLQCSLRMKD